MARALSEIPNIEYRGRVAPGDAMQVIAEAAVYLCTSDEEGFPNTFTQAWSVGTPVVSLKIDPDSLIEQRGLGVLSGSLDKAIADIAALMASPERREAIAARARQHIASANSDSVVSGIVEQSLQPARS
jgi:glycosyltransferase involved in cell wall biosynthesis